MDLNDILINVDEYSFDKYLKYSVSTIAERAIPYIHDGLKPVHRRIIFAMIVMGIKANDKPKKSARIVGDVIGKYHPHGDGAVYNAMVRLSQKWEMRYPIVWGQGNFGSRDGDGPAAMRYTESKITEFAEHVLLKELREGTVDYLPNYDGTMKEVQYLPARLHNLLLNGSEGIAVGMATKIPSHNIREIANALEAYIDNNDISIDEIMEHISGPDFATGGQIIDSKEKIIDIYKKGSGSLRVRACWHFEKLERGQWQVVITELPPDASTASVFERINAILNPMQKKDNKGKLKPLEQKIMQEKTFLNSILSNQRDESDEDHPIRLVLIPRSSRQDKDEFMNLLIPRIGLEETYAPNFTLVGLNNRPECKNIKKILAEWVEYRLTTIIRRLNFYLKKYNDRIHVLDGRISIYNNLREAIDIIREEDDPKAALIEKFSLTEIQADDILDIKLRQLAKLEKNKLLDEKEKLTPEVDKLNKTLSSPKRLNSLMKKEIEEDTSKFEDKRRTVIKEAEQIVSQKANAIINESITVIYTKDGWLTQRKGHNYNLDGFVLRFNDKVEKIFECTSLDVIAFIGSNGRSYSVRTSEIPSGKNDLHVNSLVDISPSYVVDIMMVNNEDKYIFSNSSGYGFVSSVSNLIAKNKAGKKFLTLPDNHVVFKPIKVEQDSALLSVIASDKKSSSARLLSFDLFSLKELDKGKGVQLIRLSSVDKIKSISISRIDELELFDGKDIVLLKEKELNNFISSRGLRGKKVSIDHSLFIDKK